MSRKLINAIRINISNILFSTAVKLTLLVVFLASAVINFWPAITGIIHKNNDIYIKSNIALDLTQDEDIHVIEKTDAKHGEDISVDFSNDGYKIVIKTEAGKKKLNLITAEVLKHNLGRYIGTHKDTLTEADAEILLNKNITIESEVEDNELDNRMFLFILSTGILIFLLMSLLLIRVGAEVGNEKGSKVTEIILTSVSKKQFYTAHIVGSMVVILVSFALIFGPIVAAMINNNADITQDYGMIGMFTMVKIFIHCIITGFGLMALAISVCSFVKNTEDIGPLNLMVMAPMFASYIIFGFTVNSYQGAFKWATYVPVFSFFQNFCGIIKNEFSNVEFIVIEGISILFLGLIYKLGQKVFSKNIAVDA